MDHTLRPGLPDSRSTGNGPTSLPAADQKLRALSSLLDGLDQPASIAASTGEGFPSVLTPHDPANASHDNQQAMVRLGMAGCLFVALRAKHPPTANHSLRVALACSSWAAAMKIPDTERDEIEVASLLHDIGKIGGPDDVLRKPSRLTQDELALMSRHHRHGLEILLACCKSRKVLETVRFAPVWFDGSRNSLGRSGTELPLGSRMIAIVDAFDAMTTDHVYRRAMSRDRAIAELFESAATQFDPTLVQEFFDLNALDQIQLHEAVTDRWLHDIDPRQADSRWQIGPVLHSSAEQHVESMFNEKLLDNMHDGVIFVDTGLQIIRWNGGAETLTGLPTTSVVDKRWLPNLVEMWDEREQTIQDDDCPIAEAIRTGARACRKLSIATRDGSRVSVEVQVMPVVGTNGVTHGATLVLHDRSSETNLEERVQSLHIRATRDPLTQIHNRAEFDRTHARFVKEHLDRARPCSLIIADIDRFKQVNDTFGHQAGDNALVSFAALLQRSCRRGDLVARYGGEEFVLLCTDCDNATAAARAERIRRELAGIPQSTLNGKRLTASFGVTEVQMGDTPETMLRRADRAVYQAKKMGRNTVVQLGSGIHGEEPHTSRWWRSWLQRTPPDLLLKRNLVTTVPLKIAMEKLRGFVADHEAEILSLDEDKVVISFESRAASMQRCSRDRNVPFLIELTLAEKTMEGAGDSPRGGSSLRATVHVAIRPKRNRDRRQRNSVERARRVLSSLKSYLTAQEEFVHEKHKSDSRIRPKYKRARPKK